MLFFFFFSYAVSNTKKSGKSYSPCNNIFARLEYTEVMSSTSILGTAKCFVSLLRCFLPLCECLGQLDGFIKRSQCWDAEMKRWEHFYCSCNYHIKRNVLYHSKTIIQQYLKAYIGYSSVFFLIFCCGVKTLYVITQYVNNRPQKINI